MKLYALHASPPCRVSILAFEALGQDYELVSVDMTNGENRSPNFLKINPQGQIPVLVDGDVTVTQSLAIAKYICNAYGATAKNRKLYPNNLRDRTKIDELLFLDVDSKAVIMEYVNLVGVLHCGGTGVKEAYLEKVKAALDAYERILSKQDYLVSKQVTIADLAVLVTVGLLDLVDFEELDFYPGILKWKKRMSELPYYNSAYLNGHEVLNGFYRASLQKNIENKKPDEDGN